MHAARAADESRRGLLAVAVEQAELEGVQKPMPLQNHQRRTCIDVRNSLTDRHGLVILDLRASHRRARQGQACQGSTSVAGAVASSMRDLLQQGAMQSA